MFYNVFLDPGYVAEEQDYWLSFLVLHLDVDKNDCPMSLFVSSSASVHGSLDEALTTDFCFGEDMKSLVQLIFCNETVKNSFIFTFSSLRK